MKQPVGILLAAGQATRFGSNKLLHPMSDGSPMVVVAARAMQAVLGRVVVVIREEGILASVLQIASAEILICPTADAGMGASLACGISFTSDANGWVIALGDMPFIQPDTIRTVVDALQEGAAMVAPVFPDGRRGHPVGFSAEWRSALSSLCGEDGARKLLWKHRARLHQVPTQDMGCLRDVDIPADLE
ncbi:molybdenum cofactor cytidylyltransferase [Gammaproteobacteria bacterium]